MAKVSIACFRMMYQWSETKGKKRMHTHIDKQRLKYICMHT